MLRAHRRFLVVTRRFNSADIERELVQYILTMEGMMFGITFKEVRGLAFQMAERNNIPHPFKNGVAGKDWLQGFMSRHPELSLRQPEATSAATAHGFNRQSVNRFFDLLTALVEEHNFPPDKIYNVDETGMTTVQTRPSKIIALRGKRQVGALTSAERGPRHSLPQKSACRQQDHLSHPCLCGRE